MCGRSEPCRCDTLEDYFQLPGGAPACCTASPRRSTRPPSSVDERVLLYCLICGGLALCTAKAVLVPRACACDLVLALVALEPLAQRLTSVATRTAYIDKTCCRQVKHRTTRLRLNITEVSNAILLTLLTSHHMPWVHRNKA